MQSVRPLIGLRGISAALGLCAGQLATDLGAHQPGFRCVLGLLILVFTVQGLRGWGRKRPQLL